MLPLMGAPKKKRKKDYKGAGGICGVPGQRTPVQRKQLAIHMNHHRWKQVLVQVGFVIICLCLYLNSNAGARGQDSAERGSVGK